MTQLAAFLERPIRFDLGDARVLALVVIIFGALLVPGIRIAGFPMPTTIGICALYIFLFNPQVPRWVIVLYTVVLGYMLLVSTRNAASATGTLRDFLFLGLCLEALFLTISLNATIELVSAKTLARILTVAVCVELGLQILEWRNIFGFNTLAAPLLDFWGKVNDTNSYADSAQIALRAPGSFGSPILAGTIGYLLIRSIAILTNRRWLIPFAIIPLFIGGARFQTILFIIWDVAIPVMMSRYRLRAFAAVGFAVALGGIVIAAAPDLFRNSIFGLSLYLFSDPRLLYMNNSVWPRLVGMIWTFSQPFPVWLVGGITTAQIDLQQNATFSFDSELSLRSAQFGLLGYACFAAMDLAPGFSWRNKDWWFILYFTTISTLTTTVFTGVLAMPFLILYGFSLRKAQADARLQTARLS